MSEYVIEMLNICKSFGSLKANDDITIQLKKGEIHALLGENGAGKSTLMSILFGLNQMDSGVIKKNGKVVNIKSPNDATKLRIGMVHQHFKLVDIFTVMRKNKIEPKKVKFVYSNQNKKTNLVLIKGVKNGKQFLEFENNLYVYNENGKYTDEILKIYNKI